jgi:gluconolactonase
MLLFSDVPANTIYKWTQKNGKEVYLTPSGYTDTIKRGGETGSNGLVLNPQGRLVMCQHGNRQVAEMEADLGHPAPNFKTIADTFQGKKFNSPNDAVFRRNGDLFFTDPPYGLERGMQDSLKEIPYQGVYLVKKSGEVKLLLDSLTRPNGIALTPDEKTLIITNSDANRMRWYTYDVVGDSLVKGRIFYDATAVAGTQKGAADGLKIDKNGNIFSSGPGGIWVFDRKGKVLGKFKITEAVSNCSFSRDQRTLYVTADMYVLRIKLR